MSDIVTIEAIDNLMSDLDTFCNQINAAKNSLVMAANVCMQVMNNDMGSAQAVKDVATACQGYEDAIVLSQKLQMRLGEKRQEIIEYLNILKELE